MVKAIMNVFDFSSVQEAYEGFKDSMEVRVILHGIFGPYYQISKATIQQTYSVDKDLVERAIGREHLESQIFDSFKKLINEEAQGWFLESKGYTFEQYGERLMGEHQACICKIKDLGDTIVSKTIEDLLTCNIHTGELQQAIEALCIRAA